MQALTPAEGPQGDPKTSRQQRKAILDDTKARLDAILTPEQQQELTKMLEHRHGRGPRGGQGGSWKPEGATTPSA
jgi:hypothetical protein